MKNGIIFTDGSYDNGVAPYAYVAQPNIPDSVSEFDYDANIHSSGSVEGTSWDLNSYRAELRGILAAIEFTNAVCKHAKNIKEGSCTLYYNSKRALYAAFGQKRPTPWWTSFDLVTKIRRAIAASPITWYHIHIKGHQDKQTSFQRLDYFAKGNVIVDHLASVYLRNGSHQQYIVPQPWFPSINNQQINGNLHQQLRYNIYKTIKVQYL
jgi:RNase H.